MLKRIFTTVRRLSVLNTRIRIHTKPIASRIDKTEPLPNSFCDRTHNCGELRADHIGENVTLCGWLQYQRMGKFMVLRDHHGITQVTLTNTEDTNLLETLNLETVIQVEGTVKERPKGLDNPKMHTGRIEIIAEDIKVLNTCADSLPFNINEFHKVSEKVRMENRHIDLRHSQMQHNLRLRSKLVNKMRHFLCVEHDFVDVETPTLFRKTPGGAQEFVVPTRIKGEFYSLPQSPQQFKQLLMVGGIDRYMQIARCYRDESTKPERQPEFTQVDIEMSFVTQEHIKSLVEQLIGYSWPEEVCHVTTPFPRISYHHAMTLYGCDKPDTRFDMTIKDVTSLLENCDMGQIRRHLDNGGSVYAIIAKQAAAHISKKDLEAIKAKAVNEEWKEKYNSWHALVKIQDGGVWPKSMTSNFGDDVIHAINRKLDVEGGDMVLLAAGAKYNPCEILGKLRLVIVDMLEAKGQQVREKDAFNFLWVEDFPLFLPKEGDKTGSLESTHHPFTAPHPEDFDLVYTQPLKVRGEHYDLVLNGSEIGGGSIRIHNSQLQRYVIEHVLQEDSSQLEHLLRALDHGCPPHGGIALGLDRLVAIACAAPSIRGVIAFPKSHDGRDLMARAPAPITDNDKRLYHLS